MISRRDIEQLVKPYLALERIHLFEVKVSGRAGRPLIQLVVDHETANITIAECAHISREVQDLLDIQDWAPADYQLMVSSPGVGYPLREVWQFRKNIGRTIQAVQGDKTITGRLTAVVDSGDLRLEIDQDTRTFSLHELFGSKVIFEKPNKRNLKRKRDET
jgi:ribosome maturation factor RimP